MADRIKFGTLEGLAGKKDGEKTSTGASKSTVLVPMSDEMNAAKDKHDEMLRKFHIEMRARTIAAPTHDQDVKHQLRNFQEPICLFGEGPAERRDRLKTILAKLEVEQGISANEVVAATVKQHLSAPTMMEDGEKKEVFYTEGVEDLKQARAFILNYSLPRSRDRLVVTKRKQAALEEYIQLKEQKLKEVQMARQAGAAMEEDGQEEHRMDEDNEVEQEHNMFVDKAGRYRNMDLVSSQVGDVRPISGCAFSPDAKMVATCSWSAHAKVWDAATCEQKHTLLGHAERLTDVKFHPAFQSDAVGSDTAGEVVGLATASADMRVKLWSNGSMQCLHTLEGHVQRLARIAFHPSGRFLGTASFDRTWRLWDLETQKELLVQEGHSRQLYCIAFQGDGALAATCGLDSLARVWDLRTGRSVMALQGHVKQVLGIDFCPATGVKLATGSDDNTIRLWDLRRRKTFYTIPAHPRLVSAVKYSDCGDFLFSSSYDKTCKVWNLRNHTPVRTLAGHDEKVMAVDVDASGSQILTASYDRTFKLWAPGQLR